MKQAASSGAIDQSTKDKRASELLASEAQLVQTIGQREQTEKELRLLIGATSLVAEAKSPGKAVIAARKTPQGPIVEKMNRALEKLIQLEFYDKPLSNVMEDLSGLTGVKFSVQLWTLDEVGISSDQPVSLHTNNVPLSAALQAFEDAWPGLQFVLRDYGVLLTTKVNAQEHGYVPVLEFSAEANNNSKQR